MYKLHLFATTIILSICQTSYAAKRCINGSNTTGLHVLNTKGNCWEKAQKKINTSHTKFNRTSVYFSYIFDVRRARGVDPFIAVTFKQLRGKGELNREQVVTAYREKIQSLCRKSQYPAFPSKRVTLREFNKLHRKGNPLGKLTGFHIKMKAIRKEKCLWTNDATSGRQESFQTGNVGRTKRGIIASSARTARKIYNTLNFIGSANANKNGKKLSKFKHIKIRIGGANVGVKLSQNTFQIRNGFKGELLIQDLTGRILKPKARYILE